MRRVLTIVALAGFLCAVARAESDIEKRVAAIKKDVIDKMTAAAPEKATVQPAKPHKILFYTLPMGFPHSSIPFAAKSLEIMGKKTGAYEVTITDDASTLDPENLKQYDAIVQDQCTGDCFQPKEHVAIRREIDAINNKINDCNNKLKDKKKPPTDDETAALKKKIEELKPQLADPQQRLAALPPAKAQEEKWKQAVLDFVKGGKAIIGVHAATDCYYGWRDYGEMMGGYFSGHPYNKHVAKLDDPTHPIMAAFEGKPFDYADEMYVFGPKGKSKDGKDNQTYSRDNQRVLMSIDAAASKIDIKAGGRADGDYAISWIRNYGQGRVFYCSYGHNESTWWQPKILRHYLDGIQWALGDLKADATPVPLKAEEQK